jgi:hypothetical protein
MQLPTDDSHLGSLSLIMLHILEHGPGSRRLASAIAIADSHHLV